MKINHKLKYATDRLLLFKDWWKTVGPLKRFYTGEHQITLRNGRKVWVRDYGDDIRVLTHIYLDPTYPIDRLVFERNPIILDLGANIGAFAIAVQDIYPQALIVCYEPDSRNIRLLRANVPIAYIYRSAVTNENATVDFYENKHEMYSTTQRTAGESRMIVVPSISLRSILSSYPHIDLLKIDIEGSETSALLGTAVDILDKVDNIFIEIHKREDVPRIEHHLNKAGLYIEYRKNQDFWFKRG